ncbi:MAG: HD domain-containing protein [Candidatus Krumholzibacteriota bacterium]|nr:HD domain-containing protein [Candidatus Krumholzibacteriota bacterium]
MSLLSAEDKRNRNDNYTETIGTTAYAGNYANAGRYTNTKSQFAMNLAKVNKELWIILSLIFLAGLMNYAVTSNRIVLSFYFLPTLFAAYVYGRRHSVLTAFASTLVIFLLSYLKPDLFSRNFSSQLPGGHWYDLSLWAALLIVTSYAMGTLYERHERRLRELNQAYHGIMHILRQFISKDKYTENHCYRVSVYAAKIAAQMGLPREKIEDVRAASLLHDLGKLEVSRSILYKASRLTQEEQREVKSHADRGAAILNTVEGPLSRIIPIILAHHDKFDGSGYHETHGKDIPLEARIIAVADVYDALTSDRPYRKAMSPFDAKENIARAKGTEFDPDVVEAFLSIFSMGEMEVPEVMV